MKNEIGIKLIVMNKMTEENFKLRNGRFLRTYTKCDDYIAILIFGYFSSLNFFIDWKLTFFSHFYAFFLKRILRFLRMKGNS